MSNVTRKLASIQRINDIQPIEGADAIEHCRVLGWWVVGKKGEFKVGDLVVYIEIDSFVPHEIAPFLSKGKEPREYEGVKGERLRTVKLRGAVSQGLLLPVDNVNGNPFITGYFLEDGIGTLVEVKEGDDVTAPLGIQKWEPAIPVQMQGQMVGYFPKDLLPKTDAERIQNVFDEIDQTKLFEKTVKLDGSSCTIMKHDGQLRVCSRNIELKTNKENEDNIFVRMGNEVFDKINQVDNIAIQGELMGPGIQGNREKFDKTRFFVFSIFDITEKKYFTPEERIDFCLKANLEHVPVLSAAAAPPESVEAGLEEADAIESINNKTAEGIVYKSADGQLTFKCISNKFLLKTGG